MIVGRIINGKLVTFYDSSINSSAVLFTEQTLTEEQKSQARENIGITGSGAGGDIRLSEITLNGNKWQGNASPYSQIVTIDGITENSQVDLTPSVEQLAIFYDKSLAFVAENEDGVVTVYAIGQKPENDYTIQVTITEVIVHE